MSVENFCKQLSELSDKIESVTYSLKIVNSELKQFIENPKDMTEREHKLFQYSLLSLSDHLLEASTQVVIASLSISNAAKKNL